MSESLITLQERITHLERHLSEQDTEVYRLSQRVDLLQKELEAHKLQLQNATQSGSEGPGSPADEKPPHY